MSSQSPGTLFARIMVVSGLLTVVFVGAVVVFVVRTRDAVAAVERFHAAHVCAPSATVDCLLAVPIVVVDKRETASAPHVSSHLYVRVRVPEGSVVEVEVDSGSQLYAALAPGMHLTATYWDGKIVRLRAASGLQLTTTAAPQAALTNDHWWIVVFLLATLVSGATCGLAACQWRTLSVAARTGKTPLGCSHG